MKRYGKAFASCVLASFCLISASSGSAPVMVINTANPLFQPSYQLVVNTGTLGTPVCPQAQVTYTGPSIDPYCHAPAPGGCTGFNQRPALQSLATTAWHGMINGSLVANGYSTNVSAASSTPSTISLGLSGLYSLNTSDNSTYSTANFAVGITDLTESCQRYGMYTAFVTANAYVVQGAAVGCLTLPVADPLALSPLVSDSSTIASSWLAVPYMSSCQPPFQIGSTAVIEGHTPMSESFGESPYCFKTTRWVASFMPSWAYYADYSSTQAVMASYTLLPAFLAPPVAQTLQTILKQLPNVGVGAIRSYWNWHHDTPRQDSYTGQQASYARFKSRNVTDAWGNFDIPAAWGSLTPAPVPKGAAISEYSEKQGFFDLSSQMRSVTVSQSALPQFVQLQDWFMHNVNMQFLVNGFPKTLPESLVSMQGVTPQQPYSTAYSSMITALFKTAASVTPSISNFVTPVLSGGGTLVPFGSDTLFVPLMMADPLWATAQVSSSTNAAGFSALYEYQNMKVYTWQSSNSGWTVAEQPAQKIGYAGDITTNAGGGITPGTDFDPRKSPMSDFYSMLSF